MSDTPSPQPDDLTLLEQGKIRIVQTLPYSPAVLKLVMSNESELYGCAWPGCSFVSTAPQSIGSHHRAHTGKAAQKRRGKRRPRAETPSTDTILTAALSALDRVNELVDALDAWNAEFESVKEKAAKWDALKSQLSADS